MKVLVFILWGLLTLTFSQSIQITDVPGADCSNMTSLPFPNTEGYYAFEAKTGANVDIYIGRYDAAANTFTTLQNITANNSVNKYPNLFMRSDTLYIVYQSLISGNTRIVYNKFYNNTVSGYKIISGSVQINCTNPGLVINGPSSINDSVYVYFLANNSVFLKNVFTEGEPQEVFAGDMDVQFSFPSFVMNGSDFYGAALMKGFNSTGNYIQMKKKTSTGWSLLTTFSSGKENDNLRLMKIDYTIMLGWDITEGSRKDIYLLPNFNDTTTTTLMRDNYPFNNFDLHADQPLFIITETNLPIVNSHAFKTLINDSLFIRVNKQEVVFNAEDSLIYTSVKNTSLYVGHFGTDQFNAAFFTVWEDSIESHKQLFGRRSIENISGINDNDSRMNFTLDQNYPNPFNPSTKIKYNLASSGMVQIKVFDLLGKEISTLVNDYKPAGSYETEFNANGLTSGVYFYRITAGGFSSAKKMLLIR